MSDLLNSPVMYEMTSEQYVEQIRAAEKRGAVKGLRGFAAGFALDNDPTSRVLAARIASNLMDRAHLIEHGEVDLDGTRIESGDVTP